MAGISFQGPGDDIRKFCRVGRGKRDHRDAAAGHERAAAGEAGRILAEHHADLDGLIHNGAMWLPGSMADVSDHDIVNCIASASIGSLILTRRVLPNLMARKHADIHTVVSTAGLQNRPLMGVSVAFRAAKSAQTGFSQGLSDELAKTNVRVTAVYPGLIEDISPADALRDTFDDAARTVSNREVVDAILFTLNSPPRVRISSLVIETLSG